MQIQANTNYFACGVPSGEFEFMRATSVNRGSQVQSNWCWAACIQMVLNYHGLYVNQMDVVTRIYGSPYVNQPANERQILAALSGWAADTRGRYSAIHAYGGYTSVQEIVNGLAGKWPLIVGLSNPNGGVGHAYVLTGIYYQNQYDYYGNVTGFIPDKVVLRDPWPGNRSRQEFSWREFQSRCFMAVKVWVTRY
ncbi:MAG: papain-like cysteine protease family protein [Bacteroidota bacterium]